jgi:hypothetical protein
MSAAEMFLNEMIEPFKKLKGNFTALDYWGSLENLSARALGNTVELRIEQLGNFNILNLSIFANLQELVIFDKQKYKLLYDLYFASWQELLELLQGRELRVMLELRERRELRERLEQLEQLEELELRGLLELLELRGRELRELRERRERRELLFKKNKDEIIKTLQPIEDFLKKMKLLQEKLPNCKMWY